MLGFFDLKNGVTPDAFSRAFADMAEHLKDKGLLENWAFLQRQEHEGYDASPPPQTYIVEMIFGSGEQAQNCWDYIEKNPRHELHWSVNRKVTNSRFALYEEYR